MINELSVLEISPHYRGFSKGIIDGISSHIAHIDCIIYHNFLTEIFQYLPMGRLSGKIRENTKRKLIERSNQPSNVTIHIANGYWGSLNRTRKEYGLRLARLIISEIRKKDISFDIIHCHFIWPFGFIGSRLHDYFNKPLVITAHGYDIYDLPYRSTEWQLRIEKILNSAQYITTVSRSNASYIEKLKVDVPYEIISNGFDSRIFFPQDQFECRYRLGLPTKGKLIIAIGNLKSVKGHRYLIEAMKSIVYERDDIRCVIIGTGDQLSILEKIIRHHDLQEYVFLVGSRPHEEIPIWINASNIIAIPSLMEGCPTVMFESLACGKPIIASDVGGISQVINNNVNGLLCRAGDSNDLSVKLLRAIDKEWDSNAIRRNAERYSYHEIGKKYLNVFCKILHS